MGGVELWITEEYGEEMDCIKPAVAAVVLLRDLSSMSVPLRADSQETDLRINHGNLSPAR
jgi:hypothetical protein